MCVHTHTRADTLTLAHIHAHTHTYIHPNKITELFMNVYYAYDLRQ